MKDRKNVETVGGQAVIEGVMLRDKKNYAVAVRKENGEIISMKEAVVSVADKHPILKKPFLRGMVNFIEQLKMGYGILIYSANQNLKEGEKPEKESGWGMTLALIVALGFAILLFKALPYGLTVLLGDLFKVKNIAVEKPIIFNIIAGVLKLSIFFLYIYAISFMKDMRRMFQYHGAEHKVANAYEAGETVTPESVKKYPTLHPRCGTTFMFLVLAIGVVVYIILQPFLMNLPGFKSLPKFMSNLAILAMQIALLPIIAGISYEVLKLAFRFEGNILLKAAIAPGLLFQKISTAEPDDSQIEVAIKSFTVLKGL
ncbi:MAG: DUF1385 domain-containing protein [Spirochaetes bacterium]|nr:DUF1385 domain-containing protein [Spirochaetota bacterium]